jgi:hypothetical protein
MFLFSLQNYGIPVSNFQHFSLLARSVFIWSLLCQELKSRNQGGGGSSGANISNGTVATGVDVEPDHVDRGHQRGKQVLP